MVASAMVGTDRGRAGGWRFRRPRRPHPPIPTDFRRVHHQLVTRLPPPIWRERPFFRHQIPPRSSKIAERSAEGSALSVARG
jgi:hypothetical protein